MRRQTGNGPEPYTSIDVHMEEGIAGKVLQLARAVKLARYCLGVEGALDARRTFEDGKSEQKR